MGYTKGRKFTDEELLTEAKKYKTKRELKALDNSLLSIARRRGIPTSKLFEHMVDVPFSIPQLMCKLILETILQEKCLYDTRQIIKPYELDIYFPTYKLAFEYCGDYWHHQPDAVKRDKIKKEKCREENITLIVLNMRSRRWEEDVKQQIIEHLKTINTIVNKNIVANDVLNINCKDIYKNLPAIIDLDHLKKKINECNNLKEFSSKFKREYRYLINSGQLHLLDSLRSKIRYPNEINKIIEMCLPISCYNDFIQNHNGLYLKCIKLNILKEATKHMKRHNKKYAYHTNEQLLIEIPCNIENTNQLKKTNLSLYNEILKRRLFSETGLAKPRKWTSKIDKSVEYFNENIVPLIERGLTVNQISNQSLLPFSYNIIQDFVKTFASVQLLQKLKQNKSNSYRNKKKG